MQAGVWQRIHEAVLRQLREYDQIMWDRASVDAASVPAPAGGEHTGRNPTDRGKLGCKHHLLVDQRGLPLVAKISGAKSTTRVFSFHSSKPSQRLKGFADVRVNGQVSCTLIERTLHEHIAIGYADGVSQHVSRDTAWSLGKGSADGVGSLSAP
jgi:transposase